MVRKPTLKALVRFLFEQNGPSDYREIAKLAYEMLNNGKNTRGPKGVAAILSGTYLKKGYKQHSKYIWEAV